MPHDLPLLVRLLGVLLPRSARHLGRSLCLAGMVALAAGAAQARDDGRYAQSPLKGWFDGLKNQNHAPCCSDADGRALSDVEWESKNGQYRVLIDGEWYIVPEEAVITEPNRAGRTMVWPYYADGKVHHIVCFMPGPMI